MRLAIPRGRSCASGQARRGQSYGSTNNQLEQIFQRRAIETGGAVINHGALNIVLHVQYMQLGTITVVNKARDFQQHACELWSNPLITKPSSPLIRIPYNLSMAVSKHQGPYYGPQIVGLILQGRHKKDPNLQKQPYNPLIRSFDHGPCGRTSQVQLYLLLATITSHDFKPP